MKILANNVLTICQGVLNLVRNKKLQPTGRFPEVTETQKNYGLTEPTTKWTLEMRQNAQNRHFRQDRLCMYLIKPVIQATRSEPAKNLTPQWGGHSCIGDIVFKSLDNARDWAAGMGYEGIYL